ncbi:hypothetical protein B0J13DRAFT_532301 [Dactylonectria estremocensis]|uniref:Fungal-type protein kinase domain-containing protein n=1 Tax=Dactylonectria estremocensis TaxID=1079267 RepID=A0A9P9DK73_9HYPO|nr:hypothetical protein B0J13DRAFT_532301 [Dactylonectria estremocensis]
MSIEETTNNTIYQVSVSLSVLLGVRKLIASCCKWRRFIQHDVVIHLPTSFFGGTWPNVLTVKPKLSLNLNKASSMKSVVTFTRQSKDSLKITSRTSLGHPRSGLNSSELFSAHDLELLITIVAGSIRMGDAELGMNPLILFEDIGNYVLIKGNDSPASEVRNYYLEGVPIAFPRRIVSQDSTCYWARRPASGKSESSWHVLEIKNAIFGRKGTTIARSRAWYNCSVTDTSRPLRISTMACGLRPPKSFTPTPSALQQVQRGVRLTALVLGMMQPGTSTTRHGNSDGNVGDKLAQKHQSSRRHCAITCGHHGTAAAWR